MQLETRKKANLLLKMADLLKESDQRLKRVTAPLSDSGSNDPSDEEKDVPCEELSFVSVGHSDNNQKKLQGNRNRIGMDLFLSKIIAEVDDQDETQSMNTPTGVGALVTRSNEHKKRVPPSKAALKLQAQQCQFAIAQVRENAALKYGKVELANKLLKESVESQRLELKAARVAMDSTTAEKLRIDGRNQNEVIRILQEKIENLERKLEGVKIERDAAFSDNEQFREQSKLCTTCKLPSGKNKPPAASPAKRSFMEKIRETTIEAIQSLENETVVASLPLPLINPPQEITPRTLQGKRMENISNHSHWSSISTAIPLASADVSVLEYELKKDLERLRSDWNAPPQRHHESNRSKKRSSRRLIAEKVIQEGGNMPLDLFLSKASKVSGKEIDTIERFRNRSVDTASITILDSIKSNWTKKRVSVKSIPATNESKAPPRCRTKTKVTTDDSWEHTQSSIIPSFGLLDSAHSAFRRKMCTLENELDNSKVSDQIKERAQVDGTSPIRLQQWSESNNRQSWLTHWLTIEDEKSSTNDDPVLASV